MADDALTAALELHAAGYCPVQARADGTKAPVGAWKVYQNPANRPTGDQLRIWFGNGHPGLGIVTGQASGNVEVLEFEGRAVAEGVSIAWGQLMVASGLGELMSRLLTGYLDATPGGGLHLHYRIDGKPVPGNTKLARRPATADELAVNPDDRVKVLIETRGEGGFVVTAPSNGATHPTGKPWLRKTGGPQTTPVLTVDEHDALMAVCQAFDRMSRSEPTPAPAGSQLFQDPVGSRPGDEFNARASWPEILEPRGWIRVAQIGDTTHWRRPGKSIGISATTGHGDGDDLYVFSTATVFDAERFYDKFGTYAVLEHGGDFVAASRALTAAGWGRPASPEPAADTEAFWSARPVLQHLHDFARARVAAPWAVFGAALVRAVCTVQPSVRLPAIVGSQASLNLYLGLVGESGSGKGIAKAVARDAIDFGDRVIEDFPIGTGEGVAATYMKLSKGTKDEPPELIQYRFRALFHADEIDGVKAITARSGATLLPVLRSAYSGETIGNQNADPNRRLPVARHSYRLGFIAGIQPARSGFLLDDADAGTPQRFLWMPTADPDAPDDPPPQPARLRIQIPPAMRGEAGPIEIDVCRTAADLIRRTHLARTRGGNDNHLLDGHGLLTRLKVAAALGILAGRLTVTDEDWQLAGVVMAVSDHTRAHCQAVLAGKAQRDNAARARAEGDRQVIVAETVEDAAVKRVARTIVRKLTGAGWVTRNDLRKAVHLRDRGYFDAALDRLIEAGQVEPDETDHGVRYRLIEGAS